MFSSGLMLLTLPLSQILTRVGAYVRSANKSISKTLYISIEPNKKGSAVSSVSRHELIHVVPKIYAEANRVAPYLDVRVLHPIIRSIDSGKCQRCLQFPPQIVLTNQSDFSEEFIRKYIITEFNVQNIETIKSLNPHNDEEIELNSTNELETSEEMYDNVVLGGTFDNLHNGHKVLLSSAQLHCNTSLTIGVTDVNMIKNKLLWELIQPLNERIKKVNDYVRDVDPCIEYKITPINDPFGPAIEDQSLQCLVVSRETIRGGNKVNDVRKERNMSQLNLIVVDLVTENHKQCENEEEKISSSSLRIRKLGTVIKPPEDNPNLPKIPYLIGLTGGIASGKTSIAEKLQSLGAGVIYCDILAHESYKSPSLVYNRVVEEFGTEILNDNDNEINRKRLGKIVFNDPNKLKKLNNIVWPEVEKLIEIEINKMKNDYRVIFLETALLIEAKLNDKVHQVWVTIIDEKEAIARLKQRNLLSEDDAKLRINAQLTNYDRVCRANVVFCTLWDHSFTMVQVKRAWNELQQFL